VVVEAVRLLITLALTALGFELAPALGSGGLDAEETRVLGAVIGAGIGYVGGGAVGRSFRKGLSDAPSQIARQLSGAQLFTGAFGMMVGIAVGAMLSLPVILILPATVGWPIAGLVVFLFAAIAARVFAARSEDLMASLGLGSRRPMVSRRIEHTERSFMLDASAVIDGRVLELVRARLIEGRVWLPSLVIDELQNLADSGDVSVRRRGRRGLDVMAALHEEPTIDLIVVEDTVPDVADVDAKLLRLAEQDSARLITSDHNLSRAAEIRGVPVLNPNVISDAVRAPVEVGTRLAIPISRSGREPGQGIGYLDDGTMVVVEGGSDFMGEELEIEVTNVTRTSIGRMLFAKLAA
jgi:uncharacterized protein YacL